MVDGSINNLPGTPECGDPGGYSAAFLVLAIWYFRKKKYPELMKKTILVTCFCWRNHCLGKYPGGIGGCRESSAGQGERL